MAPAPETLFTRPEKGKKLSADSPLEKTILPLFYRDLAGFTSVMIHSIAINGSFFNTQRMMQQYVLNAYYAR